jgi:hypothetical protein
MQKALTIQKAFQRQLGVGRVPCGQCKRNLRCLAQSERVYQNALQAHYKCGHKRLPSGISDVTTADRHIEIKRWPLYKQALGQLLAYDYYDKKPILEAHLFGEYPDEKKEIAIKIFNKYNISVVDLAGAKRKIRTSPSHLL